MQNAIIVHGVCDREEYFSKTYPSPSNSHWLPWLQKQLLMAGYECQTPEMPAPYAPSYQQWCEVFKRLPVHEDTILIGHSAGCGFLLRRLSETGASCARLIMVAPWIDPYAECGAFLDFTPDANIFEHCGVMHVLYSQDDPVKGVSKTIEKLQAIYPGAHYHDYSCYGHFCQDDLETSAFPDLYKIATGQY